MLASVNLDLGGSPPFPGNSGSLCLNRPNNMIYAEHRLSSWESGILYKAGRGCLRDQHPLPTLATFYTWCHNLCCHNLLLEELSTSCTTLPPGKASGKLVPVSPGLLPYALPFANFASLSFTLISPCCEHDCVLSPGRPPSESLKLGTSRKGCKRPCWLQSSPRVRRRCGRALPHRRTPPSVHCCCFPFPSSFVPQRASPD